MVTFYLFRFLNERLGIKTGRDNVMICDKITITNPSGLHLRPAGIFCKEAMRFKSQITFGAKGSIANAKSVLSVLGACVKCGDVIELCCDGEDVEREHSVII